MHKFDFQMLNIIRTTLIICMQHDRFFLVENILFFHVNNMC